MFHCLKYVCYPTEAMIRTGKTKNTCTVKNEPCSHALSPHNRRSGSGCLRCALLARDRVGLLSMLQREQYQFQLHGFSAERERGTSDRGTSCFGYCFVNFLVKTLYIYFPCLCCSSCNVLIILTLWVVNWRTQLIGRKNGNCVAVDRDNTTFHDPLSAQARTGYSSWLNVRTRGHNPTHIMST